MRDFGTTPADTGSAGSGVAVRTAPTVAEIREFQQRLGLDAPGLDDATRIDRLRALEVLRCATESAQAETTADFVTSRRRQAADQGVRPERCDRGLGCQVGLARRESPHRGQQHLALAMIVRTELPCTRAAFRAGRIDAWRATLIARETACLSAEHRAAVDQRVAGDPDALEGLSIGRLIAELARWAAQLDPAGVAARRRRAEADRHTSLRPAPETMTWFSALLPVRDGVGVHAALDRQARRLRADGDQRTLGQLRADLLVAWILHPSLAADATRATTTTQTTTETTGTTQTAATTTTQTAGTTQTATTTTTETQTAASGEPGPNRGAGTLPVMVNLVVPDTVLLGDHTTHDTTHNTTHNTTDGATHDTTHGAATGWVEGHGPVPGDLLREWIAERLDADTGSDVTAWVRRVYTNPAGGLVAMDSRAGYFTGHLAEYLRLRDQRCRTPYCDARIRHLDHVVAKVDGGPTTAENGQGLCEACNYAKQAPGWSARPRPGPRHTVEITTPTGHSYTSMAPAIL